ncbi:hypothetical protein BSR29_02970 [Boudabousia liubingyangii]|uniref:ABC transporter domain-containing protein n=1 Tax=Boudabousia liubingyangii TaxID=1921764 RepID=A0A1Q5PMQ7_9ACTO|nr:ATP-binding cassette domain-containing protein [Boudabousia liubingyangii]OKL47001.1 hypothetical protein BSR28_06170 [Boudabousia liubingyangii]OKL48834.1 hypothetical protein BSR29_02970 [Boudabousia liubingyangii]
MIEIRNLHFSYRNFHALKGVSLRAEPGVYGLLGPNGAGKSTLMKSVVGMLPLQKGEILINGKSLTRMDRSEKRRLGYLPQHFDLMDFVTVERNLIYAAWAHGIDRNEAGRAISEILEITHLGGKANVLARSLSGGMRQRLGIACALVHRPRVALLDEPTVGLDPLQRAGIRNLLLELSRESVILISTHLVEDLAAVASRVLVMNSGLITFDGTVDDLNALGERNPSPGLNILECGYQAALARIPNRQ